MSDNRKYYYLKLKENYFDDDSIVLLESIGAFRKARPSPRSGPEAVPSRSSEPPVRPSHLDALAGPAEP